MFDTPILFLIFKRPDTTRRVFERIREIRPAKLYIAADGPRPQVAGEAEQCEQTRGIVRDIDWPCEVKTLFRKENLGCKQAIYQGISWFFEQEEMGIILEDDCLPAPSFFPFCEELLVRYKDDDRIGHIGGNIQVPGLVQDSLSYDFCSVVHIWGWATWRRVWRNFDLDFPFWEQEKARRPDLFCNKWEEIYFSSFIPDSIHKRHGLNTWDSLYYFSLHLQNQLAIYPAVNLVANIGLGDPDATHTKKSVPHYIYAESMPFPLRHPHHVMRNKRLDRNIIRHCFFSYKRLLRYLLRWY